MVIDSGNNMVGKFAVRKRRTLRCVEQGWWNLAECLLLLRMRKIQTPNDGEYVRLDNYTRRFERAKF